MARQIKDYLKKWPVQLILVIAITIAMIEFLLVSAISYEILKEVSINNIISYGNRIKISLARLMIINVSMIIQFIFIILLLRNIFKKINYYAFYSCITGLPNKNFVLNSLIYEISVIREFAALISLDMDGFKAVNDKLGHLSGDELLRQAGKRLKKITKLQDCVCHIGGDEFIFFIRSAKDKLEVEKIAKEIINAFDAMFVVGGKKVNYVTASLGIALIPQDGKDFHTIYNCADDAMYSAKNSGKNGYKFYDKNMSFHIYEESVKKKEIEEE
jgi:diguanylate cyclase (GGDEF)-like protein